jgi:PKD repeat protein
VAGVCGLIKSANPTWTPAQIRDKLVTSAIDIVNVESGAGWDRYSGYGMVDAEASVSGDCDIVADFTVNLPTGCAPLNAVFTDLSTGTDIDGWLWDFGDGIGTSTDQNPSYTYDTPGTYTVTLTASSSSQGCSDDEVKVDYIEVLPPPVADFEGSPLSGPASLTVDFTDLSTGDPYEWSWDFGDGICSSTAQNPSYTYDTPGKYTVELTVTALCGTDVESKFEYINVTEPGQTEKAYAYAETNTHGTVSGDFTDTWTSDNVYETITETISDNHPRKTTSWLEHRWELNVPSGTNPTFYLEAYRPANSDGDNFLFEYSTDGSAYTSLVTVASATEQVYSVGLPGGTSGIVYIRVTDSNRSWGNNSLDPIYVDEMYIEVETTPGPPVADFVGDPTSGFAPLTVYFTDKSTGSPTSWDWDFGDGVGTSAEQNPVYTYNNPGIYTVTLIATNAYGSDTETKNGYITVNEPGLTVHVSDITVGRRSKAVFIIGQAWVTVVDNDDIPVSGATVYGYFDAPNTSSKSGTTGSNGVALIEADKTKTPPADYCFTVTDIVYSGGDYNPAANLVTKACESGWVYSAGPDLAEQHSQETPESFVLGQNYPNPFNPVTSIMFGLPEPAHVRLDIFNVKGELVKSLVNEELGGGYHTYEWNAACVSSGIYFYRIVTADFTMTRKMILLR